MRNPIFGRSYGNLFTWRDNQPWKQTLLSVTTKGIILGLSPCINPYRRSISTRNHWKHSTPWRGTAQKRSEIRWHTQTEAIRTDGCPWSVKIGNSLLHIWCKKEHQAAPMSSASLKSLWKSTSHWGIWWENSFHHFSFWHQASTSGGAKQTLHPQKYLLHGELELMIAY